MASVGSAAVTYTISGNAGVTTLDSLAGQHQPHHGRFPAHPTNNVTSDNVVIEMNGGGEHCERIYNATNWRLRRPVWIDHTPYGGASLALKQCDGFLIEDPKVSGHPWQLGRNPNDPPSF